MPRYFECELAAGWKRGQRHDPYAARAARMVEAENARRAGHRGGPVPPTSARRRRLSEPVADRPAGGRQFIRPIGVGHVRHGGRLARRHPQPHEDTRGRTRGVLCKCWPRWKMWAPISLFASPSRISRTTAKAWEAELQSPDQPRRLLAAEVARLAEEGRYSVAPLFLDADRQIGQLVVVDGTARRIVRVRHERGGGRRRGERCGPAAGHGSLLRNGSLYRGLSESAAGVLRA